MEIKLQKWGNSQGIRIPQSLLKSLNLKVNDFLDIFQEEDRIIISKSKNRKISLKERFEKYNGENQAEDFVWDNKVGKEIW